ncbi:MAG: sigma-70 family RNA polymerase sigma factor [Phycisphaerales bacterium]
MESQRRISVPIDEARELALVRAIQGGDTSAWAELLTRYQDRLFGVCLRMVGDRDRAADYTQDAMVRIIEGLASYDGRAKLSTWVIRVTMNVCFSRLRAEKLRRHASLDSGHGGQNGSEGRGRARSASDRAEDFDPREHGGVARVEHEELRRHLAEALLRISPEQRAILVLRDSRGLEYEQIAEVLDVPVGTVKSRLFRARAALREVLEGMGSGAERAEAGGRTDGN